jgi:hypothetical protein
MRDITRDAPSKLRLGGGFASLTKHFQINFCSDVVQRLSGAGRPGKPPPKQSLDGASRVMSFYCAAPARARFAGSISEARSTRFLPFVLAQYRAVSAARKSASPLTSAPN